MKVLIDWDSTTNNLDDHMIRELNQRFGLALQKEDITDWYAWYSLTEPHMMEWLWGDEAFGNYDWTMRIPANAGAVEAIHELAEAGAEPVIVSDRKPHMASWIEEWFRRQPPHRQYHVIITDKVNAPKYTQVWAHNMQFAVEDAPHNAVEIANKCDIPVFLVDMPYNRDVKNPRITRVKDLSEAVANIREVLESKKSRFYW